jgi:hypothetical protein
MLVLCDLFRNVQCNPSILSLVMRVCVDSFSCFHHLYSVVTSTLLFSKLLLVISDISIPILVPLSAWIELVRLPCLSYAKSLWPSTVFPWSFPSCYPFHFPVNFGLGHIVFLPDLKPKYLSFKPIASSYLIRSSIDKGNRLLYQVPLHRSDIGCGVTLVAGFFSMSFLYSWSLYAVKSSLLYLYNMPTF